MSNFLTRSRRIALATARGLRSSGLDLNLLRSAPRSAVTFRRDLRRFRAESGSGDEVEIWPIFADLTAQAGSASGHYFHQDLWAARKIYESQPLRHIDIGSRLDGFVAHVLTFMPVTVVDIRPIVTNVVGLAYLRDDMTSLSSFEPSSVSSLSCLHAIEHVGLGRYGDEIDPEGPRKAADSMIRILQPSGKLYLGIPIGRERTVFNAHRVFSPSSVCRLFEALKLTDFAAVDDDGSFRCDVEPNDLKDREFGLGLFEYTKVS
jgi:Caenorhabditis protein of unknown function, DUF268